MWNDRDTPIAHLITFRSYGTWLHGNERGSVDREHNRYRTPYAAPNENRYRHHSSRLKGKPVRLDARRRRAIEEAIRDTCVRRSWLLRAFNIRTNHVHTVVSIGLTKPEIALNAFKANATRHMRENGCWQENYSPWVDKGSKRNLWTDRSVALAIDYVINGQGHTLPDFDYRNEGAARYRRRF